VRKLLVILALAPVVSADPWTGTFSHPQISIELKANGSLYEGTLTVGGKPYPVRAALRDGRLEGSFTANGAAFKLSATLSGDTMTLVNDGRSFELKRNKEAVNPFDEVEEPAPAPAPAPPPQPGPTPPPAPPPVAAPAATPEQAQAIATLRGLPVVADPQRRWTILVYLDADNNLEADGINDLNEMESSIPPAGVEVIALVDRAKGFSNADGDWTDARLLRVRPDPDREKVPSPILARLGEVNMGDPALLAAFLEGGFRAYPAQRRMVVMWNHGGGWASMASDDDNGAGGHDGLSLPKMRAALTTGLRAAAVGRLDILGFDMCLMAQIETAAEAAPFARYMVASQALAPGDGWPYERVLPLFADPAADPGAIGRAIPKAFDEDYDAKGRQDTTLCCLDLDRMGELVAAFDRLLARLEPEMGRSWPVTARSLFFSESYMDRMDFRAGPGGVNSLDMMDLLRRVRHNLQPFPAEAEFEAFRKAHGAFVLASHVNAQRRLSTGLSIYGPVSEGSVNPEYEGIAFARQSRWPAFLRSLYALQKREVAPPVIKQVRVLDGQGNAVGAVKPLGANQFEGIIEGKNIIWTMTQDGIQDAQRGAVRVFARTMLLDDLWMLRYEKAQKEAVHTIDLLLPEYKDGETKVRTEFDGLTLQLTNGKDKARATVDVTAIDPGSGITTLVLVEHASLGAGRVQARLTFDRRFWRATQLLLLNRTPEGKLQPREVVLDSMPANVMIYGVEDFVKPDGQVDLVAGAPIAWEQGIRLCAELAEPGDYEAILTVETMSGVSSTSRFRYKVESDEQLIGHSEGWKLFKSEHLIGTWDQNEVGEKGALTPTGSVFRIERHPEEPAHYLANVQGPGGPADSHKETWILDLTGFPILRILTVIDGEESVFFVPAIFGISDGKAKLIGKFVDVGGVIRAWVKREPVQSDLDRIQPVETPEPEPLR